MRTLPRQAVKQQPPAPTNKVFTKCKSGDALKHKITGKKRAEDPLNGETDTGSHFMAQGLALSDSNGDEDSRSNDKAEERRSVDNEADKENAGKEKTEESVPEDKHPVRKTYFQDIVKEAMRQSDISFTSDPKAGESEECVSTNDVDNVHETSAPKINIKSSWNTVSVQVKPNSNFAVKAEPAVDLHCAHSEGENEASPVNTNIERQVGKANYDRSVKAECPSSTGDLSNEQVLVSGEKILGYGPLLISQNGNVIQQVHGLTVMPSETVASSFPHPLSVVSCPYSSMGQLSGSISEKNLKIVSHDNVLVDALRSPAVVVMPEGDNLPFCPMSRRNFIIKDVGVVSGEPVSLTQL